MKRFVSLLAVSVLFPAMAWVWWVSGVTVTPSQVSTQVHNDAPYTVWCTGAVYGQLSSGYTVNTWMRNVPIPPSSGRVLAVTTNPFNPFVGGYTDITCSP